MATKMSNKHLYTILLNANRYYTPDIYIALVHISVEVKDTNKDSRFVIQIGDSKKSSLINVLCEHTAINRQTIVHCVEELEKLEILKYSDELLGWELVDMINMLESGYTPIRDILLKEEFKTYKLREKKLLMYMCHLLSTNKSEEFRNLKGSDFVINVNDKDNTEILTMWRQILNTKSKYYAASVMNEFLEKINCLTNITEEKRKKDFRPKKIKRFVFYCNVDSELKRNYNEDDWISIKYARELEMIHQYISNTGITLTKQKIYQIAHGIGSISSWIIKEFVCRKIINKYIAIQIHKSRDDIKSLPAYLSAMIKNIIVEFKNPKNIQTDVAINYM